MIWPVLWPRISISRLILWLFCGSFYIVATSFSLARVTNNPTMSVVNHLFFFYLLYLMSVIKPGFNSWKMALIPALVSFTIFIGIAKTEPPSLISYNLLTSRSARTITPKQVQPRLSEFKQVVSLIDSGELQSNGKSQRPASNLLGPHMNWDDPEARKVWERRVSEVYDLPCELNYLGNGGYGYVSGTVLLIRDTTDELGQQYRWLVFFLRPNTTPDGTMLSLVYSTEADDPLLVGKKVEDHWYLVGI
jgi:hypothetical protein